MEHTEHHFTATEVVRDIVIGMSDGLTVPFALAAGLSGTVQSTRIVVIPGLAGIRAGYLALGLGGRPNGAGLGRWFHGRVSGGVGGNP